MSPIVKPLASKLEAAEQAYEVARANARKAKTVAKATRKELKLAKTKVKITRRKLKSLQKKAVSKTKQKSLKTREISPIAAPTKKAKSSPVPKILPRKQRVTAKHHVSKRVVFQPVQLKQVGEPIAVTVPVVSPAKSQGSKPTDHTSTNR